MKTETWYEVRVSVQGFDGKRSEPRMTDRTGTMIRAKQIAEDELRAYKHEGYWIDPKMQVVKVVVSTTEEVLTEIE